MCSIIDKLLHKARKNIFIVECGGGTLWEMATVRDVG